MRTRKTLATTRRLWPFGLGRGSAAAGAVAMLLRLALRFHANLILVWGSRDTRPRRSTRKREARRGMGG